MEPTPEECSTFGTIDDVLLWAGFRAKPEAGEDLETARGALLAHLDVRAEEHPRVVGNLSEELFTSTLANMTVNTNPLTVSERSKVEMFGKAARICCGRDERIEVVRKRKHDLDMAQATAAQTPEAVSSAVAAVAPAKKVKLSTVADQANDMEVVALSAEAVATAYANYEKITNGQPPPDVELTADQLTSLHALLGSSGPPYVDFSVWGPFGHRIAKKMKLTGLILGADGNLQTKECFGPSTFLDWEASFKVYRTGCIMLNAVSISALDAYRDLISNYVLRYGQAVWLIIYQADVRARLEHLERARRKGARLHAASAPSGDYGYDTAKPWDWCFRNVTEDHAFWRRELEEPAILVLSKSGRLMQMVDGDAPVQSASASHSAAASSQQPQQPPKQHASQQQRGKAQQRGHYIDDNGRHTANRRGTPLCADFQAGSCSGGRNGMCTKGNLAHQCAKCLSVGHGADACYNTAAKDPAQRRFAKNDKGGKGGKGGKRPQY
jgi:hypothetical protein